MSQLTSDIIQSRAAHSKQGGVNVKKARISVLAFTVIDPFGVFTNKARTPVLALGSLELIASPSVLAFNGYLKFSHAKYHNPVITHIQKGTSTWSAVL